MITNEGRIVLKMEHAKALHEKETKQLKLYLDGVINTLSWVLGRFESGDPLKAWIVEE